MADVLVKLAYEAGALGALIAVGIIGYIFFKWWKTSKDSKKAAKDAKKAAKAEAMETVFSAKRHHIDPHSEWDDEVSAVKSIGLPGVDFVSPATCKQEMDRLSSDQAEFKAEFKSAFKEVNHKLDVVISSQHQLAREFQNGIHESEDRMRTDIVSGLRDHVVMFKHEAK